MELIVAGALERTVVLRSFLGNVARVLVREAHCSVMLFTKPEREPKPLRRIAFYVPDYSEHALAALRRALRLAELERCEHFYVIRVYSSFDAARATLRANQKPSAINRPRGPWRRTRRRWKNSSSRAGATEVGSRRAASGATPGFAASDFVQTVEADLLVVPVEATGASDGIPAHIAWVDGCDPVQSLDHPLTRGALITQRWNNRRLSSAFSFEHLVGDFSHGRLPFALAALARRSRSRAVERVIGFAISALLIGNYIAYLILFARGAI